MFGLDEVKAKIAALYQAGLDFDKARSRLSKLQAVAARDPATLARYNDIMTRGGGLKSGISAAVLKVQEVYAWIKSNLGLNLGALPLIPIALLSGVVAATTAALAWISEANNEARRLEIIASLPADKQVAALRNPDSISGNISKTAMWLALGAVAIFVLPKFMGRK